MYLQTKVHTQCLSMSMFYLHAKFHMPSFNSTLITTTNQRVNCPSVPHLKRSQGNSYRLQGPSYCYYTVQSTAAPSHALKGYGQVEVQLCSFLTSALHAGDLSALCPSHFTTENRSSGTHWVARRLEGSPILARSFGKRRNVKPLPGTEPKLSDI
jgi:hypothetical protein